MAGIGAALRRHQRVGLDTSVFIYHLEGSILHSLPARRALQELASKSIAGVTSILTIMELIVKPIELGRIDVANSYEALVASFPNLVVADIDGPTARRAARLRATYRLRPVDALQIAACLVHGASAFLTNDRALRRVTELKILLLKDFSGS